METPTADTMPVSTTALEEKDTSQKEQRRIVEVVAVVACEK